jgi:hypothetical protein
MMTAMITHPLVALDLHQPRLAMETLEAHLSQAVATEACHPSASPASQPPSQPALAHPSLVLVALESLALLELVATAVTMTAKLGHRMVEGGNVWT